jgi:hypothetical protein
MIKRDKSSLKLINNYWIKINNIQKGKPLARTTALRNKHPKKTNNKADCSLRSKEGQDWEKIKNKDEVANFIRNKKASKSTETKTFPIHLVPTNNQGSKV